MQLPILPEVIAITETKNNPSNIHLTNIKNYQFSHVDSPTKAGGIGVFVRNDLRYILKADITVNNQNCESIFFEI